MHSKAAVEWPVTNDILAPKYKTPPPPPLLPKEGAARQEGASLFPPCFILLRMRQRPICQVLHASTYRYLLATYLGLGFDGFLYVCTADLDV